LDVLPEIFVELDSADRMAQDTAIAKLAQIGNKEAFRKLHQLLDDNTNRDDNLNDHLLVRPKASRVMYELYKIFDDMPKNPNGAESDDIAA
jgi:hypothetical protein